MPRRSVTLLVMCHPVCFIEYHSSQPHGISLVPATWPYISTATSIPPLPPALLLSHCLEISARQLCGSQIRHIRKAETKANTGDPVRARNVQRSLNTGICIPDFLRGPCASPRHPPVSRGGSDSVVRYLVFFRFPVQTRNRS